MKNKAMLSLVMAAALTLGGAGLMTNANFNATAKSTGNAFTMGTVQLQRGAEQTSTSIEMDRIFNGSAMVFDKVSTTSATINVKGNLPVALSAEITDTTLPSNEAYTVEHGFQGSLTDYFKTLNPSARWWRQYKMAVTATVVRDGETILKRTSRDVTNNNDQYDSFFDVLNGTKHEGAADTRSISAVLASLGTLQPNDVVTITTDMKLVSDLGNGNGLSLGKLTNEQQNIFQGLSIGANLKIVATQAN